MRFSLAIAALAPVLSASAANILVQVGAGGLLAFSPPNVTANVGDVIAFQFQGKNHSVTQSTFANPCAIQTTPAQGIDSGFQPVAANATELPEWSFTVNNASAPLWFFCAQTNPVVHCNKGMVFSVNANPDSAKSFAAYMALAMTDNVGGAASAVGSAASAATSAIGSAVAGGVSDATSAIAGAVGAATSAAAGAVGAATSAAGAAAGAAATDAASILGAGASALTAGGAAPSASGNSTNAAAPRAVVGSTVSLFAVVGLAAVLL